MIGKSMATICFRGWLRFLFMCAAWLLLGAVYGQPASGQPKNDSLLVLSPDEYLNVVRKNHPVAKQALLLLHL